MIAIANYINLQFKNPFIKSYAAIVAKSLKVSYL